MAITTLNQALLNSFNTVNYVRQWTITGTSSGIRSSWAGSVDTNLTPGSRDNTLNGVTLTYPVTGALPIAANTDLYLTGFYGYDSSTAVACSYILCDRLWHNGNINATSTSTQSITSPTWPARDVNGSTNGEGVMLALEVASTMGGATPTITVEYTNSAGTSGRTATNVIAAVAASGESSTYLMGLQAGDTGVRSVQSITLSTSWLSGSLNLVAYRPIMMTDFNGKWVQASVMDFDPVTLGLPFIHKDSVLYFMAFCSGGNATPRTTFRLTFATG